MSVQAKPMRLLTVSECARELRISKSKCYALCTGGQLPHFRVGNAIRISEEQLQTYLARVQVEGGRAEPTVAPPVRLKHLSL